MPQANSSCEKVHAKTKAGAHRFCDGGHEGEVHHDRSLDVRFRIENGRAVDVG